MTLQLAFIRWDLYRYLQASSAKYDEIINRGVFTLSSTGWKISGPTKQKFGVTIITNMLHSFWTTIFFWVTSHEPHEECGCFTCRPVIGICEHRGKSSIVTKISIKKLLQFHLIRKCLHQSQQNFQTSYWKLSGRKIRNSGLEFVQCILFSLI